MKRGFIFTADALFAIAVVIIASGVILSSFSAMQDNPVAYKFAEREAMDNAVVAIYKGNSPSSSQTQISADAEYGACFSTFKYNLSSGTLEEKRYCGERP